MKIIAEGTAGFKGYRHYLVEAEPQRQLVWFRPGAYSTANPKPLDIPLPRSLYVVRGPSFKDGKSTVKAHQGAVTHMYALENNGKKVISTTPVYLLPWPNYYSGGQFSLCHHEAIKVPDDATVEQAVEDTIIKSWGITFGYLSGAMKVHGWLGITGNVHSNIQKRYQKWEKLSVEEAADLPWGRYSPAMRTLALKTTNKATVKDVKGLIGIK